MKKLFKNKKGFTLMEMLIVVAIIVILVAVSMPVFSSQLTKAKEAADDANVRAAKAVATAEYLDPDGFERTAGTTYYYNADKGIIVNSISSTETAGEPYGKVQSGYVTIVWDTNGVVTTGWSGSGSSDS